MGLTYSRTMIVPKCKLYDNSFQNFSKQNYTIYCKKDDKWYFHIDPVNPLGLTKFIYKGKKNK